MAEQKPCELCEGDGGVVLWRDERLRVVRIVDPDYPAFCRVVWNAHVKELTDLAPADCEYSLKVVLAVERTLRSLLSPDKINVASLGNMTPHLHWHVIPRFVDDRHFPNPVWAAPVRAGSTHNEVRRVSDEALTKHLAGLLGGTSRD